MKEDEKYMQRCLELAKKGFGNIAPNPMVGCIIVYKGVVIGEGFHQEYEKEHAEVNAIDAVTDKSLLSKSTLYVNLEPCAHFGKTPPCADLITKHQLKKVVIGCEDSFSKVAGRGIEKLKQAGCEVEVGALEKECRELNKRFFTFHEQKRPYIILKWAQSKDGFIGKENEQVWLTSDYSKKLVHQWRTEEQAILVGTHTAKIDNPQLTARLHKGKNPLRIVIDKNGVLDRTLRLFNNDATTLVFTSTDKIYNSNTEVVISNFDKPLLPQILKELHNRNILSIIIEGGAKTIHSFLEANLWDEARVFTAEKAIEHGIKAPQLNIDAIKKMKIGSDTLEYYYNQ